MSKFVPVAFHEQELVQSVAAWNSNSCSRKAPSALAKVKCNPMGTFFLCIRGARYGTPKLFNTASCRGTNMFIANDFIATTVL